MPKAPHQFAALTHYFFNQSATTVARQLLGMVVCRYIQGQWLYAQIIETEAYGGQMDHASHAIKKTPTRAALWQPAGTLYMYYARGGDSLNISTKTPGAAVLIKSGRVFQPDPTMLALMQYYNPLPGGRVRQSCYLLSGQTLFCRSLGLNVKDWNGQQFNDDFFIVDLGHAPDTIIQTTRLGIPAHRDQGSLNRFIDMRYASYCSKNPLKQRKGVEYRILSQN